MNVVDIIKLIALLICCVIATKTDLQYGIISNKLVVVFGAIGMILDVLSMLLSSVEKNWLFLQNAGMLIGIALLLYFFKIWAGGDCKLLIVVALLYPSSLYWRFESTQFTLWYMLGFMFGTGYLYLMAESMIFWLKEKEKRKEFAQDYVRMLTGSLVYYSKALVFMSALSHIYLQFVYPLFYIPTALYAVICLIYIRLLNNYHFFDSKMIIICFFIFDLGMTFFTGKVTVNTLWETYLITLLFMIVRSFINQYNYKMIETTNVKEGMILSRMSTLLMQKSRVKNLPPISDESLGSRISEEEAASIIRWSKTKNGSKQIIIVRKIPFAIFITCGILIYLAFLGALQ